MMSKRNKHVKSKNNDIIILFVEAKDDKTKDVFLKEFRDARLRFNGSREKCLVFKAHPGKLKALKRPYGASLHFNLYSGEMIGSLKFEGSNIYSTL